MATYANYKRLFPEDNNQSLNEDMELEENCKTSWYSCGCKQLDACLKFNSLKLKEELIESRLEKHFFTKLDVVANRLQVNDNSSDPPIVFQSLSGIRAIWRSRFTRLIWWLFLCYIFTKFTVMSVFIYKRDSSSKEWTPILRAGARRYELCTLSNESRLDDPTAREAFRLSNEWLDYLGSPYKSDIGVTGILIQSALVFILSLYVLGLINVNQLEPRFDYLNFIINPNSERRRIQLKLSTLARRMMNYIPNQAAMSSIYQPDGYFMGPSGRIKKRIEAIKFVRMLEGVVSRSVRPANLTPNWHRALIRMNNLFLPMIAIGQTFGLGSFFVIGSMELYLLAKNRLEAMDCAEWMPNGVLIKDRFNLQQLDSQADLDAYKQVANLGTSGFWSLIKLGLFVEFKQLVQENPFRLLSLVELLITMSFTCLVFPTYLCLYWWSLIDKIKWIRQVEEQLDCCERLCYFTGEIDSKGFKEADERLVRCLIITYLNFLLFKSQLIAFLPTSKVFIKPMVLASLYLVLLFYIMVTQTPILGTYFVMAGVLFFTLTLNVYLATAAFFLSKSQKMTKSILNLVIRARGGSSNRRIITELWRRQLLNPDQLKMLLGISLLGETISYPLLIKINFYLILLCIILGKTEQIRMD